MLTDKIKNWRKTVSIVGVISAIVIIFFTVDFAQGFQNWDLLVSKFHDITAWLEAEKEPCTEDSESQRFRILILPFDRQCENGNDFGKEINDRLNQLAIDECLLVESYYLDTTFVQAKDEQFMEDLRDHYGYDQIIYGKNDLSSGNCNSQDGTFRACVNYATSKDFSFIGSDKLKRHDEQKTGSFTIGDIANGELQGDIDYIVHYVTAYTYLTTKKYQKALEYFLKIKDQSEGNARYSFYLGTTYHGLNRSKEALKNYDQAITLDPKYATAYYNRGGVLDDLGRKEEALASYDHAITLDPIDASAYSNRGVVLKKLGHKKEALESYDWAITLDPKNAMAYNNRGNVLVDLDRKEEALASYDHAINLDPKHTDAYNNRGNVLDYLDRKEEALASYDQAITLDPKNAGAYSNRGNVLSDLDRKKEALASYDQAITLDPKHATAYSNRV